MFLCFSGQNLKLLQFYLSRLEIAVSSGQFRILENLRDIWHPRNGEKHVPAFSAVRCISAALQKSLSFVCKLSVRSDHSSAASNVL